MSEHYGEELVAEGLLTVSEAASEDAWDGTDASDERSEEGFSTITGNSSR